MANDSFYFPGVTLLVTHYNRSGSLERLLSGFRDLGCRFDDIVVADDASRPEHLEKLKAMQDTFHYRLITTGKNTGLPANMNRGQDAVRTPLILYVQEDFTVKDGGPQHLMDAVQFMNEDPTLDYIRCWSFYRYPTLRPYGKGFSRIVFSAWNLNHRKFFMYSDNPHLRRNDFFQKFGRFREDLSGDVAEYRMSLSFIRHKGKGLFYEDYDAIFEHKNSAEEPSSFGRPLWRQSTKPIPRFLRWCYLKYKFTKSILEVRFLKL